MFPKSWQHLKKLSAWHQFYGELARNGSWPVKNVRLKKFSLYNWSNLSLVYNHMFKERPLCEKFRGTITSEIMGKLSVDLNSDKGGSSGSILHAIY